VSARRRIKLALLRSARAFGLFGLARHLTAGTVKILGYHYVSLEDEHTRFPSLFLTPDELRRRLAHLRKHFHIVRLEDAVTDLEEGRPGRGRVALTFDDGLQNFASAAVPVLREVGAPATVYVVSSHVVNGIPVCGMLLRDVFKLTRATELACPIAEIPTPTRLVTPEDRTEFERRASEHLSSLPHASEEQLEFTRRIGRALAVDVDGLIERRIWDVLNAEEIRSLTKQGFSVQVHGHQHLNVVERPDEVEEEVSTCARVLTGITGADAEHYCYPFGLWSRASWAQLESAGIRSATTTLFGANSPATPMLSLRRYMDGGNQTQIEFEFEISGLRWLLWGLRHRAERWRPAEKLVKYSESGRLY